MWFSGVPVGTVKQVSLGPRGIVRVDMAVSDRMAEHIPTDVFATLSSDGLIGNAIVVLGEGTPGREPLKEGAELKVTPSLTTTQLMGEFQETNQQLQRVVANLDRITRPLAEGEGTIGRLLQQDDLYEDAAAIMADLQDAAYNAEVVTNNARQFTDELNRPGQLPHQIVTDTTTFASIQASADSLQTTAADVQAAVANPSTPMGVLLHDQGAGADLDETFANMNESTELLAEDLEALQHNFLLRGFFKKKERAEEKAAKQAAVKKLMEVEGEDVADAD